MEPTPKGVAQIAIAAYRAAGYKISEHYVGGGRFYRYLITAPTGEQFEIQTEEIY
jgi:hypothetical protein